MILLTNLNNSTHEEFRCKSL